MKKYGTLLSIILTIIFGSVYYYLFYPALNLSNINFWIFAIIVLLFFIFLYTILTLKYSLEELFTGVKKIRKVKIQKILFIIPFIVIIIFIINFTFSPLFNSNAYYKRIKVKENIEFTEDIKEADFNKHIL